MLSHPLKGSVHSLPLTQASIIQWPNGDASCKTVGMHRAKQASMHRAKVSGHALCKNKRFGCSMCAKGRTPKRCLGTSIVASGAKVHGCSVSLPMTKAMEPRFYGTLGLFSGPLNLFPRPPDLLLVLYSIFRLLVFFWDRRSIYWTALVPVKRLICSPGANSKDRRRWK